MSNNYEDDKIWKMWNWSQWSIISFSIKFIAKAWLISIVLWKFSLMRFVVITKNYRFRIGAQAQEHCSCLSRFPTTIPGLKAWIQKIPDFLWRSCWSWGCEAHDMSRQTNFCRGIYLGSLQGFDVRFLVQHPQSQI